MPVNITIRNVPDPVATGLRQRAADNRRSLQQEMLALLDEALEPRPLRIAEPESPAYAPVPAPGPRRKPAAPSPSGRLDMEQLWQRARQLGKPSASESTAILRADRDARNRR